jgi:transcriptional regulator with GAF, ATPase, and Fis domain
MTERRSDFEDDGVDTSLHQDPHVPRAGRFRRQMRIGGREIEASRAVIGSARGVDVVIDDPTVSRLHAEIELRDDGLWVKDLGSTNGTFVGAVRIESARIPDGATLRLGAASVVVTRTEERELADSWSTESFGPMLGTSAVMRELFARLAKVAATEFTVLVQGETGTGKELVAQAIHDSSPRANGPLVVVDCSALPENLIEAELFGHNKGAFTGADRAREGAIEAANGGTVFLDEIAELPLAMQPKLLRVIESKTLRRVGESAYRNVDVRFVAATHRDIGSMVNRGAFREDLYFRLAVVPVVVPPLRDRLEDIPLLVKRFVPAGASLPVTFLESLSARPWPGNVRELRNAIDRAVAIGSDEAFTPASASPGTSLPPVPIDRPFKDVKNAWLDHVEREYIGALLKRHAGNVNQVAASAGLDRTYVYRLVRKHQL